MTGFFIPTDQGRAGEDAYQRLRKHTEESMGRAPSKRRILELWTRRGNLDCITTVGSPDPISGEIVTAIFDMGPHQPFVVYHDHPGEPPEESCDVLGTSAYSVSEFSP
jgi:hypothetical protein